MKNQSQHLEAFIARKKNQMLNKAEQAYPLLANEPESMIDALDFVIIRCALVQQHMANERHSLAVGYGYPELAAKYKADWETCIAKIERMWPRLNRRGYEWPAEWASSYKKPYTA